MNVCVFLQSASVVWWMYTTTFLVAFATIFENAGSSIESAFASIVYSSEWKALHLVGAIEASWSITTTIVEGLVRVEDGKDDSIGNLETYRVQWTAMGG